MRGLRIHLVALACLVGFISGCAHYTHIGTDDGTITTKANKGKPIYLRTVCSPAFASIGAANGLLLLVNSVNEYWYAPIGGALVGGIVDALRCGFNPPTITNTTKSSTKTEPQSNKVESTQRKPKIQQPPIRETYNDLD